MKSIVRVLALSSLFTGLVMISACGADLPEVDCETATVVPFDQLQITGACIGCHSSQLSGRSRSGAPSDINFDTFDAASAAAEEGAAEVFGGSMPPAGLSNEAIKEEFYAWALCGTPQ